MTQVERAQEIVRELLGTGLDVLSHVSKEDLADLVHHLQGSEERVPRISYITHWATVLDVIRYGLEGESQKVRAYAELLLEKLTQDRQETIVKHLSRVLEGKKGALIYPANGEGTSTPMQSLEKALHEIVTHTAEDALEEPPMEETKPTVTLTLDATLAQIVLLALRNAEDKHLGECRFDRFVPDLAARQAYMRAFHAYNGDLEIFEEDMADPGSSQFRYFNPNYALGMLWSQLCQVVEDAGLEVRAQEFQDPNSLS